MDGYWTGYQDIIICDRTNRVVRYKQPIENYFNIEYYTSPVNKQNTQYKIDIIRGDEIDIENFLFHVFYWEYVHSLNLTTKTEEMKFIDQREKNWIIGWILQRSPGLKILMKYQ